jgi:hypothetical protein
MRLLVVLLIFGLLFSVAPSCGEAHAENEAVAFGCHESLDVGISATQTAAADVHDDAARDTCPESCPGGEDCVNGLAPLAIATHAAAAATVGTPTGRLLAPAPRREVGGPSFDPPPPKI